MAWNKLMQLIFGGSLMMAQTLPATHNAKYPLASLDEMLSFECAKSVGGMLYPADQNGPMFFDGGLAFTSVDTATSHPILVISSGSGIYSAPLEGAGVNRVRFTIPAGVSGTDKTYYLSYLHGHQARSRVFEFTTGRPPLGKDELDYVHVPLKRNEPLLSHFEYAIYMTAESVLMNLTEGRLQRDQLKRHRVEHCEHIERKSPQLALNLNRSLDIIEMIVVGPQPKTQAPTRMPASIAARKFVDLPTEKK